MAEIADVAGNSTRTRHRVALIGTGIAGSLSPALHEHEAAALGLDYSYSLFDLDHLPTEWRLRETDGVTGFNVTHPVKQTVLSQLDDLSQDARHLGAVNTVTVDEGRFTGHNTDHAGFLAGLRHGLPGVRTDRVLVLGAGGAGSAVAYALAKIGTRVYLVDADTDRVATLLGRLHRALPTAEIDTPESAELPTQLATIDGVVNATPVGMIGHPGMPFDPRSLIAEHWVADVVYRPLQTELLQAAHAIGCRTLDGGAMLVAQAAGTLALLTGSTPDLARMRRHFTTLTAEEDNDD